MIRNKDNIKKAYPFSVTWIRHRYIYGDWYTSEWPLLSEWCLSQYGHGNWEYFDEHFRFKTDADRVLFLLRWA